MLLIVACVGAILVAIVRGDQISLFTAALVPGIVRNILDRVGKSLCEEDGDDAMKKTPWNDHKPGNRPRAG